jgi:virginiamycin A acetyltransferase
VRYGTKRAIVIGLHAVTWPFAQPARLAYRWWGSERTFDFWAKAVSMIPGKIGQFVRASFYMQTLARCHYDLSVAFGSFFSHPTARVGRLVVIGCLSIVGTAEIGDEVLIASRVSVLSGKHLHGSPLQGGEITREPRYEMITIGRGSLIGEGAIVMASVGERCTVSAGSVVTRPAPAGCIAVGNPARFLRPQGESRETA